MILASDFECVQIIPGAQNGNIQVGCVECSHQLGRVSVDCTLRHTPTHDFRFSVEPKNIISDAQYKEVHLDVLALSCTTRVLVSSLFCSFAPHPIYPSPVGMTVQKH